MPKVNSKNTKPNGIMIGYWGLILIICAGIIASVFIYYLVYNSVNGSANTQIIPYPIVAETEGETGQPVSLENDLKGSSEKNINNNDFKRPIPPK